MRKVLLIGLALIVLTGCPKKKNNATSSGQNQTGGVSGGSSLAVPPPGGAVQNVRKAALRPVSQTDLNQIRTFIYDASLASGQMPTIQQISAALQQGAPQIYKKVQDKDIILTGTKQREGIWAYTAEAQSGAGELLVCTHSEIKRMTKQELDQHLRQQGQ